MSDLPANPSKEKPPSSGSSVRRQLILASLFPLIVFGLLSILVITSALQNIILNLVTQRNNSLIQAAASSITTQIQADVTLIQMAAQESDGYPTDQWIKNLERVYPAIRGDIVLLNKQGNAVAAIPANAPEGSAASPAHASFLSAVKLRQPVYGIEKTPPPVSDEYITLTIPYFHGSEVDGAIVVYLPSGKSGWLQSIGIPAGQGRQLFLVDRDGTPISKSGGQVVPDINITGTSHWFGQYLTSPISPSILANVAPSGDQVLLSITPVSIGGWYLVLAESWASILAPAISYEWILTALQLLGIILSMAMLSLSIGRIIRPLAALVQSANQLGPGSLFYPLPKQGPEELRVLTDAFNRMVIRLAEQQAAMRHYAEKAVLGQEEERQRISHELHDETVQDLVGLMQRIDLCRTEMDQDPALARIRLGQVRSLAEGTLNDLRRISNALRPSILEDLGLPSALQSLCDDLAQQMPGARVECSLPDQVRRLPEDIELSIFRVAQEAMTNIRKHAGTATEILVSLAIAEKETCLSIHDNGPGFEVPDLNAFVRMGHLGLAGMVERARFFGGKLDILSAPGEGTTVSLSLEVIDIVALDETF